MIARTDEKGGAAGTGSCGCRCSEISRQEAGINIRASDVDQERFCLGSQATVHCRLPLGFVQFN
jgi:hypothetical protein